VTLLGGLVAEAWNVPGAAPLRLLDGPARLLRPDDQVFGQMVDGWATQQAARGLGVETIRSRISAIGRFQRFTNDYPWSWRPVDVEEFLSDQRFAGRPVAESTLRGLASTIRQFCDYVADPRYQWTVLCERMFGDVPAQICFEWNMPVHGQDNEGRPGRRALTKPELQLLFDTMDDVVADLHGGQDKGWLAAARDAAALKTTYAFGLRRREVARLETVDWGTNPHAPEFGAFGVVYVRFGKATKGSAPRRRSVLTVFDWSVDVLREWLEDYRPLMSTAARGSAAWPTERSGMVSDATLSRRFGYYRDLAGLSPGLTMHCLRHSYVTHLIEDGYDPLFVQQQVGHSYSSTTALYTSVSSDFRTRTLRAALDASLSAAVSLNARDDEGIAT